MRVARRTRISAGAWPPSALSPSMRSAVIALFLGLTAWGGVASDAAPEHVLLISLDALCADQIGFGGYSEPTKPYSG